MEFLDKLRLGARLLGIPDLERFVADLLVKLKTGSNAGSATARVKRELTNDDDDDDDEEDSYMENDDRERDEGEEDQDGNGDDILDGNDRVLEMVPYDAGSDSAAVAAVARQNVQAKAAGMLATATKRRSDNFSDAAAADEPELKKSKQNESMMPCEVNCIGGKYWTG